ncbi:putative nuclear serine protease HtrA2/Nma111 [Lineolata rhizophorae]|uniref:Pro-apoptotic serine protease NMA111 n=1 Tax=Lineolata rhizophorae TaxID=578093 RepID=A0A6A6NUB7_9PEZI|nr:putative nuclear serine protease HtrA2/Nma111 [Lineolata rhizophorae]
MDVDYDSAGGGVEDGDSVASGESMAHVISAGDSAEWQATIEKVVRNVVSIHFCQTHSFDTDPAVSSEATGFVVDSEKGYILTNRHVVGAGPFWGYCIFDNHEECDVYPVYRDPVHDFGILRFNPKEIRWMPLGELKLRPDLARVGSEIRVVGNDAGEKLSILSGVISRLDRNAPEYGEGYSDFNTNYIQAAAAASGGSSGSPVVNIDGHAVALQAGGRSDGAATDYFLPLDRPLRALERIQKGEPVPRGTIQTQWLLKPFDECRRLGLTSNWEDLVRKSFPKETGMLVAEVVLPKGPADKKIEEGDILIKVNDELLTQFVKLDDILDSSVGNKIKLLVQRGGQDLEVELQVGDLHAITPDRFVSVCGASFHDLSYQQARLYSIPLSGNGVFVCESAGSFRFEGSESGWLVQTVDNKPTGSLEEFIEVMKGIPDRAQVVVTCKHLRDLHSLNTTISHIDRHWSRKMRLAVRNDETGLWDFSDIADPIPPVPPVPRKANFVRMDSAKYPKAVDIVRSFVRVSVDLPIKLDGFPRAKKIGFGLVIDADKGLVIISRAHVPYDLCDIRLTFADSIIVEGKVVFMHPTQNYVVVKYDPSLVKAPVKSAKLSTRRIEQGQDTIFFAYNQNLRPIVAKTTVTDVTTVAIPASASTPRYRAINIECVTVDTGLASHCGSGVLVNPDTGEVESIWMTFLGERSHSGKDIDYHLGLPAPGFIPIIDEIRRGETPALRILAVEIQPVGMAQVRIMGVAEDVIERIEREDPERHQVFMVRKVDSGQAVGGLAEGDIILTLDGKLITRAHHMDAVLHAASLGKPPGEPVTVAAVIVRHRQQMRIEIPTVPTADLETGRALVFAGAVLHAPHHAVRQQIARLHSGVYISARTRGSPAYAYGLAPTNFITHVNGAPTPDLPAFVAQVKRVPDNRYFRLRVVTFDNVPWVATVKKCEHYFPTAEFVKVGREGAGEGTDGEEEVVDEVDRRVGWKRIVHESEEGGAGGDDVLDNKAADVGDGVMEE